ILNDTICCGADSESGGIGPGTEYIELAIADPDGVALFDSLIRPTELMGGIEAGATGVHGITNVMVAGAPTLLESISQINAALSTRSCVLFYNSKFDIRVGEQSCYAAGCANIVWPPVIDIMIPISQWCGDWNRHQSGYRFPKLEGGHRALGDVREMFSVMRLMASSDLEYAQNLKGTAAA
ncbi:MAG: 3'-5' exonuclease, partial [Anaerolineales bacterium]|nr:3'-5' exonuclease [Anaerolineales bacterium]